MSVKGSGSFVRQAAILAAASLFVRFLGFLYRIPLTNLIGDEGMAYYTSAFQAYVVAIAISSGYLPAAISKLVSERIALKEYNNAHAMFKTALLYAGCISLAVGLVLGLGARQIAAFLNLPGAVHAIRTFAPTIVIVALLAVFKGYFQGMKTAVPTALSQTVEQIFKVVSTVLLAHIFFDAANVYYAVAGATAGTGIAAVTALVTVVVMYAFVAKDLRHRALHDNGFRERKAIQVHAIIRTSLPMIIGTGIFATAGILDIRMGTSGMLSSGAFTDYEMRAHLGQFTGKFILLTTLPISLSLALSAAVIPEISSANVKLDTAGIKHKTDMALRISMILSIPAAVGLAVLADPIIALLFPSLPDGGWLLRFGTSSIILISLVHVLTGALQGLGHIWLPAIAAFFGVIVKIPINYFLIRIPSINILGAVISTIVCYLVASGINMYFLYKHTGILPSLSSAFFKPLVASAGMGMICYGIYHTLYTTIPAAIATIFALTVGGGAYLLFMCFMKGFRQSDLQVLPLPSKIRSWLQRM